MLKPKDLLQPEDYAVYRNVRMIALLFILFGAILFLCGIAFAAGVVKPTERDPHPLPPAAGYAMLVVGLCGMIGGISIRFGKRKLSPFIYIMAVPYLLAFPLGTIFSVVIMRDLRAYFRALDRIRSVS